MCLQQPECTSQFENVFRRLPVSTLGTDQAECQLLRLLRAGGSTTWSSPVDFPQTVAVWLPNTHNTT